MQPPKKIVRAIKLREQLRLFSLPVSPVCAQLCPTVCNPMDCSLSGSSVRGLSQARMLDWAAIPDSGGSSPPREGLVSIVSFAVAGRFFTTDPPGLAGALHRVH